MSRITDYILEPKVVYTEGGFLVRVKVIDDYKYKKYIVSENLHYKTVQGSSFTLTDADTTKQAEITELKGNTTQEGTPTPSNPIEVKTVSGDNNIVGSNKNIFSDTMRQGVTQYNTGAYGTNNYRITSTDWITNAQAGTYTINANTSTTKTLQVSMVTFDTNGNFYNVSGVSGQWKTMPFTFTIPVDMQLKCNIRYSNDSAITPSEVTDIQLEKGTVATDYTEHQKSNYRVDLGGKNLTTPQYVQNAQNVENTLNADGSITSIGTPNTGYYNITTEMPIDLPAGTYTFSIDKTRQYLTGLSLQNEGGTRESKYIKIGDKSVTFTTAEKKVKFYFWSYATNGTPVNETIKYQLEKRKYSNRIQSIRCKPYRAM